MREKETVVDREEVPNKKVSPQEGLPKKEASAEPELLCSRDHIKAKGLSKSRRKSVDCHLKWAIRRKASIASHALIPTEAPMRPLCSGVHLRGLGFLLLFWLNRAKGEVDGLCAKQTHPSTADLTAFPISP